MRKRILKFPKQKLNQNFQDLSPNSATKPPKIWVNSKKFNQHQLKWSPKKMMRSFVMIHCENKCGKYFKILK